MPVEKGFWSTASLLDKKFFDLVKFVIEDSSLVFSVLDEINQVFFETITWNGSDLASPAHFLLQDYILSWNHNAPLRNAVQFNGSFKAYNTCYAVLWFMLMNLRSKGRPFGKKDHVVDQPLLLGMILEIFQQSGPQRISQLKEKLVNYPAEIVAQGFLALRINNVIQAVNYKIDQTGYSSDTEPQDTYQPVYALSQSNLDCFRRKSALFRIRSAKVVDISDAKSLRKSATRNY